MYYLRVINLVFSIGGVGESHPRWGVQVEHIGLLVPAVGINVHLAIVLQLSEQDNRKMRRTKRELEFRKTRNSDSVR